MYGEGIVFSYEDGIGGIGIGLGIELGRFYLCR